METQSLQRKSIRDLNVGKKSHRRKTFKEKKIMEFNEPSLKLTSGKYYFPKEKARNPLGEDSCFVCDEKGTIGVADGVGGWRRQGIDSGEYSRQLMKKSEAALANESLGEVDPGRVLNTAFLGTKAEGSSTACIITLKGHNLHAVNVGDSGFMLFRDNKCVYQSPIQEHYFNCPYQLREGKAKDCLQFAEKMVVPVQLGDILVAGTDGLFDNMFPSEIEEVLEETEDCMGVDELARMIAETARQNAYDQTYHSPFEKGSEAAGQRHTGGKIDDITVIVSQIQAF